MTGRLPHPTGWIGDRHSLIEDQARTRLLEIFQDHLASTCNNPSRKGMKLAILGAKRMGKSTMLNMLRVMAQQSPAFKGYHYCIPCRGRTPVETASCLAEEMRLTTPLGADPWTVIFGAINAHNKPICIFLDDCEYLSDIQVAAAFFSKLLHSTNVTLAATAPTDQCEALRRSKDWSRIEVLDHVNLKLDEIRENLANSLGSSPKEQKQFPGVLDLTAYLTDDGEIAWPFDGGGFGDVYRATLDFDSFVAPITVAKKVFARSHRDIQKHLSRAWKVSSNRAAVLDSSLTTCFEGHRQGSSSMEGPRTSEYLTVSRHRERGRRRPTLPHFSFYGEWKCAALHGNRSDS
jgi:hypothetical protein